MSTAAVRQFMSQQRCASSCPHSSPSLLDVVNPLALGNVGCTEPGSSLLNQHTHRNAVQFPEPGLTGRGAGSGCANMPFSQPLAEKGVGLEERSGRDVYSPGDKAYWELPKTS